MDFSPSMKLERGSAGVGEPDGSATLDHERVIVLSSWMMILGTIRAVCMFADLASAFLIASRLDSLSWAMLGRFVEENQPLLALGVAWPLALGMILRRTRWPEMLPAAGVTLLFLSFGGLLETVAEWNHASGQGITFGSFHLTRLMLARPAVSDVILAVLGAGQLVVECVIGMRCLLLYRRVRGSTTQAQEVSKQEAARRARTGRLAIYASVGFLVLMIRLPVWSTYLEIVNDSRIVREFVLNTDSSSSNRPRRAARLSKEDERRLAFQQMLSTALLANNSENFLAAKENYLTLIARAEAAAELKHSPGHDAILAEAHNNLAWLLATCPNAEMHDSRQAVVHARAAVKLEPATGNYWNTVGVALYRNGELDAAYEALDRSIQLRGNGGDSFDWFFLAMIDHKRGRQEKAREWYDQAVTWYHAQPAVNDGELYRFQVEAAQELGLAKPAERPARLRKRTPHPMRGPGAPLFNDEQRRKNPSAPDPNAQKQQTPLPK
jgi:tetratricopeptide (TPR) repeat protein